MRSWIEIYIISDNYKAHWRVSHSKSEDILSVIIVNHTGESTIVYSRRCSRVFIHLGLKFTSDMEDLLVDMCILLSLVLFGPCRRGAKVKKNAIINHQIPFSVKYLIKALVLMVVEYNNFGYVKLRPSTISAQCELNL